MQELKRVAGEELNQCEVDLDAEAREDDELRLVVRGGRKSCYGRGSTVICRLAAVGWNSLHLGWLPGVDNVAGL